MSLDPYAPCPCGSGKKMKWCCLTVLPEIERAFEQEELGQHETAVRILDELCTKHHTNPEVWGRKAQLLFMRGEIEKGEETLQKAFDLNPQYPWGLLMQAQIRFQEGEIQGCLLLARRAVEAYDPDAHDYLAQVYRLIAEAELGRNRPVAAQVALRLVTRYQPSDEEARQSLESTFGKDSRLPECVRKDYTLRRRPEAMPTARQAEWDLAFSAIGSPRLTSLASAFEQLAHQDPEDTTAWFNLGVALSWIGENRKALEALDHYLERETDDALATEAATLQELLRCGQGLEDIADHLQYSVDYQIQDFEALSALLQDWSRTKRLVPLPTQDQATFAAMLLEPVTGTLVTTTTEIPNEDRKVAGYLLAVSNRLRVWGPRAEAFHRLREEIKTRTALALLESPLQVNHIGAGFNDVLADALLVPANAADSEELQRQRMLDGAAKYFDETWIHLPLKSLAGNAPIDAVGHPTLRRKLLGVLQFLEECATLGVLRGFSFAQVRRKLGLLSADGVATLASSKRDIRSMSTAELAALDASQLNDEELEYAYQSALKLDATELAENFARLLTGRPGDRFAPFIYLSQRAMSSGQTDEALSWLVAGEKVDAEHNAGQRSGDYLLRRAQILIKRGEVDNAFEVFQQLIEKHPDDLRYRGAAAEGMLSARQPARALEFAEAGLELARQKNDRDALGHLEELTEAARKQQGRG